MIRLSGSSAMADVNPAPPTAGLVSTTPDALNSVVTSLTPFPSLWINELQADNLNGITNRAGQHTAWLELYNPGTNSLPLKGLYLANNSGEPRAASMMPVANRNLADELKAQAINKALSEKPASNS